MPDFAYLENTSGSHNKFYRMEVNPLNGTIWTATWGKIGTVGQEKDYPMREWSKKYDEKIKKGYVDRTPKKASVPKKSLVKVNAEHLAKVDMTLKLLVAHEKEVELGEECIRDVAAIRDWLKETDKSKGKLDSDDMIYLNKIWNLVKHFKQKN